MNFKKFHTVFYVGIDFISAALAWMLFFTHRKSLETGGFISAFDVALSDVRLYQGLVIIPLGWLFLYSFFGYYRQIYTKSLFLDVVKTLNHTVVGVIVLFFIVILDDYVESYNWYYNYIFILFVLHFGFTVFGRMVHTFFIRKAVKNDDKFLLSLKDEPLSGWHSMLKRIIDIVLSIILGILFFPLALFVIWKIKRSSEGSVFYSQERVGLHEEPFKMYKFRSMYPNAETDDLPMLSSEDDDRVTPFGRIMRKYRIDELPQLWNVLKGEMSLVGPRPERQYYIDQIVETSPQYKLLLRVKPGLTSWGEVKYGYASSVEQMIERMAFDLQYIDNMSLSNDLKILLYTIATVLKGEGK